MARKIWLGIIIGLTWGFLNPSGIMAASPRLKLQLKPAKVSLGDNFGIEVQLETFGQNTVGVDAIINFEPNYLRAFRIDPGPLYPNYPGLSFDNQKGVIKLAGSSNFGQYFSGKGILATLNFEALAEGETVVDFKWEPNSTRETNIVSPKKTDLLVKKPEELKIRIVSVNPSTNQATSDSTSTSNTASTVILLPTPTSAIAGGQTTRYLSVRPTVAETNKVQNEPISSPCLEKNPTAKTILGQKNIPLPEVNKNPLFWWQFLFLLLFLSGVSLLVIPLIMTVTEKRQAKNTYW